MCHCNHSRDSHKAVLDRPKLNPVLNFRWMNADLSVSYHDLNLKSGVFHSILNQNRSQEHASSEQVSIAAEVSWTATVLHFVSISMKQSAQSWYSSRLKFSYLDISARFSTSPETTISPISRLIKQNCRVILRIVRLKGLFAVLDRCCAMSFPYFSVIFTIYTSEKW